VGCGNGYITEHLSAAFDKLVGIDVEPQRIDEFRRAVANDPRFHVLSMSSSALAFDDQCFDLVTSFEVLEHVPELERTADEMVRVCRTGGLVILSVPQVWFPFENHGLIVNGRMIDRKIPLLPYIRPLHRRFAAARVFSSRELDRLFVSRGLELIETAYAAPQFERAAAKPDSWERHFVFLRRMLDVAERKPVLRQLAGVSILKSYRKAAA
jgi:SAM-dependent methyltransferase